MCSRHGRLLARRTGSTTSTMARVDCYKVSFRFVVWEFYATFALCTRARSVCDIYVGDEEELYSRL